MMNLEQLKSKIHECHIDCLSDNESSIDKVLAKSEVYSELLRVVDDAPHDLSPRLITKTLLILEKLNKF